jgi:hypothetical protein
LSGDPVAEHAVGDPQVPLERADQLAVTVELKQVVLGLIAMIDRIGECPRTPALFEDKFTARLDLCASVGERLGAYVVGCSDVKQQNKVVYRPGDGQDWR